MQDRLTDIENKLMVTKGRGKGEQQTRGWDWVQTTMYKIDKQQGYIVGRRELKPLFCNNF